jgi:hypothetical protein
MEPNMKLVLEEMAKFRIVNQEAAFSKHLDALAADDQLRDARVTSLEETATTLNKSFIEWRPAVDSSITAVKLDLSKLNSFCNRDARAPSSSFSGVLHTELASACSSTGVIAGGPIGHRSANDHWDCGYEHVYTHTHDLVNGTISTPPPLSRIPVAFESVFVNPARFGLEIRVPYNDTSGPGGVG